MSGLLSHKSIRVKKNTHGQAHQGKGGQSEARPLDVLVDRDQQWKHITKSLIGYYHGLAQINHNAAKQTLALQNELELPFHEGHNFLADAPGWQNALYAVRDKTRLLADAQQQLADAIDKSVLVELEGIRSEIKNRISSLEKDGVALADATDKERESSTSLLTRLQTAIDALDSPDSRMLPQQDPYITHAQVQTQLTKQVHKENELQMTTIRFQQQQEGFERDISSQLQRACRLYDDAFKHAQQELSKTSEEIAGAIQGVDGNADFKYWSTQEGALLDPESPTRTIDAIQFPGQMHPSTQPIKSGYLERKKRFRKTYKEAYYVLTPSGYLHARKSPDDAADIMPQFSLYLPECSLSSPPKLSDKSQKVHIEGNKAVKSKLEKNVKRTIRFGGKEIAYTFRARTNPEMMSWWEEMDKRCRDTKAEKTTSKTVGVDPIQAAVANAGFESADKGTTTDGEAAVHEPHHVGDEDEDEDDMGGSSAEEEPLEGEEDDGASVAQTAHTTAPTTNEEEAATTKPEETSPIADEKKPEEPAAEPSTSSTEAPVESSSNGEALPSYSGDGTAGDVKAPLDEKAKA